MKTIFGYLAKAEKKPTGFQNREYSHPLKDLGQFQKEPAALPRVNLFLGLMIIVFLIFVFRLVNLQITQGAQNLYLAEGNRIRLLRILAPRGIIYDKDDKPLVSNTVRYDLEIIPAQLPKDNQQLAQYLTRVRQVTGLETAQLKEKITSQELVSIDPIVLKEGLSQEEALAWQVAFEGMEGVSISIKPLRKYLADYGLAHILGYIGKISPEELEQNKDYHITDWVGKTGLEQVYETSLQGRVGQKQVEVDAQGRLQRLIADILPQQGYNLKLYLDWDLQKRAYEALEKKVKDKGNGKGVAVALDPRSGGVRAMVSIPSYDNNLFVQSGQKETVYQLFADENHPLVNRAISGVYPPGSTVKPIIASLALQNKVVDENFSVDTPVEIVVGDSHFPDWKDHGATDIRRAIAESNNIFFYGMAGGWDKIKGLGIDRLEKGLREFMLGSLTQIDLPNEKTGLVPSRSWKKEVKAESWYLGDTYHLGIGQGDLGVTPIQLLAAEASIINGGTYYSPRLADLGQSQPLKENFIDRHYLEVVREGMKMAVEMGSARALQGIKDKEGQEIAIGAKTGTAQTGSSSGGEEKTHAWLIAFAPYDNPEIAVLVLVEEGGQGHENALPVAKEILEEYFSQRP